MEIWSSTTIVRLFQENLNLNLHTITLQFGNSITR